MPITNEFGGGAPGLLNGAFGAGYASEYDRQQQLALQKMQVQAQIQNQYRDDQRATQDQQLRAYLGQLNIADRQDHDMFQADQADKQRSADRELRQSLADQQEASRRSLTELTGRQRSELEDQRAGNRQQPQYTEQQLQDIEHFDNSLSRIRQLYANGEITDSVRDQMIQRNRAARDAIQSTVSARQRQAQQNQNGHLGMGDNQMIGFPDAVAQEIKGNPQRYQEGPVPGTVVNRDDGNTYQWDARNQRFTMLHNNQESFMRAFQATSDKNADGSPRSIESRSAEANQIIEAQRQQHQERAAPQELRDRAQEIAPMIDEAQTRIDHAQAQIRENEPKEKDTPAIRMANDAFREASRSYESRLRDLRDLRQAILRGDSKKEQELREKLDVQSQRPLPQQTNEPPEQRFASGETQSQRTRRNGQGRIVRETGRDNQGRVTVYDARVPNDPADVKQAALAASIIGDPTGMTQNVGIMRRGQNPNATPPVTTLPAGEQAPQAPLTPQQMLDGIDQQIQRVAANDPERKRQMDALEQMSPELSQSQYEEMRRRIPDPAAPLRQVRQQVVEVQNDLRRYGSVARMPPDRQHALAALMDRLRRLDLQERGSSVPVPPVNVQPTTPEPVERRLWGDGGGAYGF